MTIPRIYIPSALQEAAEIPLDARAVNHVVRVLRLRPGASLRLFNGDGNDYHAQLITVRKDQAICRILSAQAQNRESPLDLELAQGISRGERMDYTIQKAVELGINRIVPLETEYGQVKLQGERAEKRLQHWQGVILHACEQSGRTRIPQLLPIQPLMNWLSTRDRQGLAVLLDPDGECTIGHLSPSASGRLTLLVGPEGGLSPAEREQAAADKFKRLRLGPRILRTETAALVALATIQAQWGDLA